MTQESKCKIVPSSTIFRIRGNDKVYQEALQASSKFNKRLMNERKMRIPFLDNQTKVAQANCMIWHLEYERKNSDKEGYVYTYPVKKWYKNRRLNFENDCGMLPKLQAPSSEQNQFLLNENSNHMMMDYGGSNNASNNSNSHPHPSTHKHHSMNDDHDHHKSNSHNGVNGNNPDDWHMMQEDSFENFEAIDHEIDSEAEEFDDSKKKKKRGRGKKRAAQSNDQNPDDKPHTCDKCGVKYKTKPGLSYHIQKIHKTNTPAPPTPHTISKTSDLNNDDNTNSVFESVYDDMNSSSSIPHVVSSSSHLAGPSSNTHFPHLNHTNSMSNHGSSSKQATNCGVCYDHEARVNNNGDLTFISCFECSKSFHPSCLNFTANMLQSVKKYNWQCIECKRCTHCGNSENDDKLLFCDDCDRGYHMYCLSPPLTEAPAGDWRCATCIKQFGHS